MEILMVDNRNELEQQSNCKYRHNQWIDTQIDANKITEPFYQSTERVYQHEGLVVPKLSKQVEQNP